MKKIMIPLILFLLFTASAIYAQNGSFIAETSAGNFFGVGARSMGMGGAHIASVLDGTALIYNPAALAKIRRIELQAGLSHQKFENDVDPSLRATPLTNLNNRDQTNTRLNSLNLTLPYPTYRGSLVFAIGLNRLKNFDKTFEVGYGPGEVGGDPGLAGVEVETGSLYALSGGAAIDISPHISLGAALNIFFGTDDYNWRLSGVNGNETFPIYHDQIEDDYTGVSAKAGMLYTPNKNFKLGMTIESPTYYQIEEKYTLKTWDNVDDIIITDRGTYDYDLLLPFTFGAGIEFNHKFLLLAFDISYSDWNQMEYKDDPALEADNIYIQDYYRDVLSFSIGGEYLVPRVGLKLRAGYNHNPLPYSNVEYISHEAGPDFASGYEIMEDRKFYTFGIGYLIDHVMTVDVGVALGGYEILDNTTAIQENIDLSRIYMTFGFRM